MDTRYGPNPYKEYITTLSNLIIKPTEKALPAFYEAIQMDPFVVLSKICHGLIEENIFNVDSFLEKYASVWQVFAMVALEKKSFLNSIVEKKNALKSEAIIRSQFIYSIFRQIEQEVLTLVKPKTKTKEYYKSLQLGIIDRAVVPITPEEILETIVFSAMHMTCYIKLADFSKRPLSLEFVEKCYNTLFDLPNHFAESLNIKLKWMIKDELNLGDELIDQYLNIYIFYAIHKAYQELYLCQDILRINARFQFLLNFKLSTPMLFKKDLKYLRNLISKFSDNYGQGNISSLLARNFNAEILSNIFVCLLNDYFTKVQDSKNRNNSVISTAIVANSPLYSAATDKDEDFVLVKVEKDEKEVDEEVDKFSFLTLGSQ